MLAEGPRVAPEPGTVSAAASGVQPPAKPEVAPAMPRRRVVSWYRLIPVAAFGGFVLAQATGLGKYAFAFFIVAAVVSMFFRSRMLNR